MSLETGGQFQVVIPKTQKMLLDAALPNPQHYKVRIKVDQSKGRGSAIPQHLGQLAKKEGLQVALDYGHQLYFFIYSERDL